MGIEGGIAEDEPLPYALLYPEMVPLSGGRAMITGGILTQSGSAISNDFVELFATNRAWIYDGGTWSEVRPMNNARALHAAAALPDGRVLVAGGFSSFEGAIYFQAGVPLACAEIYDPEADVWEEVGGAPCGEASSSGALPTPTAMPSVAADDEYGVLLFGGVDEVGRGIPYAALFVGAPSL